MKIIKIISPFLFLLVGIGIAALLILSKRPLEPTPPEERNVPVDVITPNVVNYRYVIESHGTVQPVKSITLSPQVQGRVEWINPKLVKGRQIIKGDELLRINSKDFELVIKKAEASVSQARAALLIEESQGEIAKRDWEELGNNQKASPLVLREPQLNEARARLQAAQADLEQAKLNLSRCLVSAPFNGVVDQKLIDVGQFIRSGEPIAQIYGSDVYEIRIPIPLGDLKYLPLTIGHAPGSDEVNQIEIQLIGDIASSQKEWKAKVVSLEADITPATRMATLVVEYQNPLGENQITPLPKGLFVRAMIHGLTENEVLVLPRIALRSSDRLYVVDSVGKLQVRRVDVLQSKINDVVVRADIETGDSIVTSVLGVFVPGQSASIMSKNGINP